MKTTFRGFLGSPDHTLRTASSQYVTESVYLGVCVLVVGVVGQGGSACDFPMTVSSSRWSCFFLDLEYWHSIYSI